MSKDKIDRDLIRALAELLDETRLTEIEIDHNGMKVRVARQAGPAAPAVHYAPAPAINPTSVAGSTGESPVATAGAVTSPMVGIVYLASEPGGTPFVAAGDVIESGQTMFVIEAMKTMNPIVAPRSGRVVRILVKDGQPVEFGEPLAVIE